ncbi:MFS transporter [Cellulomonas soli]|uniref:MFS transporter n=1 Tax=Cellulomonas soli TaxID=931535 RepID=A0A512P8I7_9CELL|nr:MFS transporter [Cellulomonas soli]NYI57737.1 EmrB/QacA subfamily drug resistance transporter [Cellulomonas soli]GEP67518.1 MFS transporter [Cellulomonas soli]
MTTEVSIPRRHWLAMGTLALGVSLVIMDATIVNVALPVVIEDLGLDSSGAQWMNAIYSLVFASLMLTVGRVGDLYGRKRLFAVGLAVFMAASLVAGASTSPAMLIGSRLVQGVGAAMVLPSTLSTLNAMFQGRERGIAFAIWGSTIGGMAAVGPLVGGWLATDVSWRWAFWLNIPFGLLALVGIRRYIDETRDTTLRRGTDVPGVLLSTLGLAGIVFGLIEGAYFGWWLRPSGAPSPVPFALLGGAALLAAFVVVEQRRVLADKVALVDLGLLRLRSFRFGIIAALIVSLGEFGLLFTLPLLLQGALGYTALGTGFLVLWLAVGTFLVSGATPQLTARIGQRSVVRIGLGLEAVAIAGLALTLSTTVPGAAIAAWLFLYGIGVGMATAQLTSVILVEVPLAESGQASGFQTTVRQLGSALGVALLGGLLVATMTSQTTARLADSDLTPAQREQVVAIVHGTAGAGIPSLAADPATAAAAADAEAALVHASKVTTGIAAGVLVVGLASTLAIPALPTGSAPTPRTPRARRRVGASEA